MTPDETVVLLAYVTAADKRFAATDEDRATAQAQVWADILAPVDAQFALDHARRYYARHHDWPLQAGAIRDAWGHHQTALAAKDRARALPAGGTRRPGISDRARELISATRAVVQAAAAAGPPVRPGRRLRPARDDVFQGGDRGQ